MKKIEVNKADVVKLLAKGYTQLETAKKLNISLSTLKRLPFWKEAKEEGQKKLEERIKVMYEKLYPYPEGDNIADALKEYDLHLEELADIFPTLDFDMQLFSEWDDDFFQDLRDVESQLDMSFLDKPINLD